MCRVFTVQVGFIVLCPPNQYKGGLSKYYLHFLIYSNTVSPHPFSRMIRQLNQHLAITVSTKTECYDSHEGKIYCSAIVLHWKDL